MTTFSAHACSEIGQKWSLFAFHDSRKVFGFVSVLDFFGVLSFPKTGEMGKTELRPFLTILGTRMRAIAMGSDKEQRLSPFLHFSMKHFVLAIWALLRIPLSTELVL
jgi:hypothetical protein